MNPLREDIYWQFEGLFRLAPVLTPFPNCGPTAPFSAMVPTHPPYIMHFPRSTQSRLCSIVTRSRIRGTVTTSWISACSLGLVKRNVAPQGLPASEGCEFCDHGSSRTRFDPSRQLLLQDTSVRNCPGRHAPHVVRTVCGFGMAVT